MKNGFTLYGMRRCLFLLFCLLPGAASLYARHNLEEIRIYENTDTRCLGISNAGFVCGYYISPVNGKECGFVITPAGNVQLIDSVFGAGLGFGSFNYYRVVDVADDAKHSILIRAAPTADQASSCTILKGEYNPVTDSYDRFVKVDEPTLNHPHSTPSGINYFGDMAGWYNAGGPGRFLWHFDQRFGTGISAARVQIGTTQYRTFTGGINDSGLICGSYYDEASGYTSWKSFSYNTRTKDFVLFSNQNVELRDVNNNGVFVGAIGTGGNTRAVMATASGAALQTIPHGMFRPGVVMQSELNGINDDRSVVGSFRHPNTNTWVGFVYQPDQGAHRMPGFGRYTDHVWKLVNTHDPLDPDAVWSRNYWGGFDYNNDDPYAKNGRPVFEHSGIHTSMLPSDLSPSWIAFMEEADFLGIGKSTSSYAQSFYNRVYKPGYARKYYETALKNRGSFQGVCYGFVYTTLLRHFSDSVFSAWFDMPRNYNLSSASNSDFNAVKALDRTQLKQLHYPIREKQKDLLAFEKVSIWEGMRYLKHAFAQPRETSNPKPVSFQVKSGTAQNQYGHIVLPWKIVTPQVFPFNYNGDVMYDTMYVYDSANPLDSNRAIQTRVDGSVLPGVSGRLHDSALYVYPIGLLNFNHPGFRPDIDGINEHSAFKPSPTAPDERFSFSLLPELYYEIASGNARTTFNAAGLNHGLSEAYPMLMLNDSSGVPLSYSTAVGAGLSLKTDNYTDSQMRWHQGGRYYHMTLSRAALPGESDYGAVQYRSFAYGTHDAAAKIIGAGFSELSEDHTQGVNVLVENLELRQGDSLLAESPEPYRFRLVRIGGSESAYDLTLYAGDGETVRETKLRIPIKGDATHTIEPYYEGPAGTQTVIFVDNGNTGSADDTLLLDGMPPAGVDARAENTPDIRVYPSPVQAEIHILVQGSAADYRPVLTDIAGRNAGLTLPQQLQAGISVIPAGALAPGVYLLQVYSGSRIVFREKIVKH